jgi:hypothetical protein
MNIEFPETREEIMMWKLEHADLTTSYHMTLWIQHGPDMSGSDIWKLLKQWLHRVAKLDCVMSHRKLHNGQYLVSLAGVCVCVVEPKELDTVYNGKLNEYQIP